MQRLKINLFLACFALSALNALGASLYVDGKANEDGNGTRKMPYSRIQDAIDVSRPKDTIHIRRGNYSERLVIRRPITLIGHGAVLSGKGLEPDGEDALVLIENASYVSIRGLTVMDFSSAKAGTVPIGILIKGHGQQIILSQVEVANINTLVKQKVGGDAHGIAVFGTHPIHAIGNLTLNNVSVKNCQLGSSEAIAINGNVDGFEVTRSEVWSCSNIGIDVIGGEGVCPTPELDYARNGKIISNKVSHISTKHNPAYGGDQCAAGIYVDGARYITIMDNEVESCDIGVEIGAENKKAEASWIGVHRNSIRDCYQSGILLGAYKATLGKLNKTSVSGNTLIGNNRAGWNLGEIGFHHNFSGIVSNNNIAPVVVKGSAIYVGAMNKKSIQHVLFEENNYVPAKNGKWMVGDFSIEKLTDWETYLDQFRPKKRFLLD